MFIIYESALSSSIRGVQSQENDTIEFIATLQEANVKNRNGRIYPKEVIDAALKGPIIQEKLKTNTLFGEVGHPYSQELARQANVDIRNASFRIEEFWWEGNLLKGKCKTLPTSLGRDMAALIREGCDLSFSMRGQGNLTRDPVRDSLVVSNLNIITFDWVWLPSHNTAYITSLCDDTTNAMFKRPALNTNEAMSLNESLSLYENGSIISAEKPKEKLTKDYYSKYGNKVNSLNETYIYSPNDKIVETKANYFILENDNYKIKVAKEDYLSKAISHSMREDVSCIAPADIPAGAESATTTVKPVWPDPEYKVLKSDEKVDVTPIKNEGMTEPTAPAETLTKKDGTGSDGLAVPEKPVKVLTPKKDETVENISWDESDNGHIHDVIRDYKPDPELEHEYNKLHDLIKDEIKNDSEDEIIRTAKNYLEFMSENCQKIVKHKAGRK